MASAQVVETSVNTNNSPSQDYTTNPDDHAQTTTLTHLGSNLSLLYVVISSTSLSPSLSPPPPSLSLSLSLSLPLSLSLSLLFDTFEQPNDCN